MRQRGRRSTASLGMISMMETPRPAPPKSLDPEIKKVWRQTTARFQPEFFTGSELLLELYADAVVMARHLAAEAKVAKEANDYRRLDVLIRLQRAEAAIVARFAGALRLSPRARFDRYSVRPVSNLPKPWELGRRGPRRDDREPGAGGSPFDAA